LTNEIVVCAESTSALALI